MNVLAITTFDDTLQVALKKDDFFTNTIIKADFRHSVSLVPLIQETCLKNEIKIKDLDLLALTRGPGSFTGLRIGMAALKGISESLAIPIVSISSLDLIQKAVGFYPGIILPIIDARKQRFYTAIYDNGKKLTEEMDVNAKDIESQLQNYSKILLTGQDSIKFLEEFEASFHGEIKVDSQIRSYGQLLIEYALEMNEKGQIDDIGQGPTYIRKSEAEINRLKKEQTTS